MKIVKYKESEIDVDLYKLDYPFLVKKEILDLDGFEIIIDGKTPDEVISLMDKIKSQIKIRGKETSECFLNSDYELDSYDVIIEKAETVIEWGKQDCKNYP